MMAISEITVGNKGEICKNVNIVNHSNVSDDDGI